MPGATDWNGSFVGNDGTLMLSVQGSQGSYVGYIQDRGQRYPFQAHIDDQTLHGAFVMNGTEAEFFADRDGASVMMYVGEYEYWLEQTSPQATP